jgi:hypothetical protein
MMEEPRFMKEGYAFIGEDEKWHIKDDAPDWAKEEFKEFFQMVDPEPDEDGVITNY